MHPVRATARQGAVSDATDAVIAAGQTRRISRGPARGASRGLRGAGPQLRWNWILHPRGAYVWGVAVIGPQFSALFAGVRCPAKEIGNAGWSLGNWGLSCHCVYIAAHLSFQLGVVCSLFFCIFIYSGILYER